MRISPKSLSPVEALAKAKAKAQARDDERQKASEAAAAQDAVEAAASVSSPAAIDAGRAQRLLERAAALSERGDMGAAILAARQSLALAPDNVEAHLLHAGLLERNRDFGGARAAYEKSVQLAPDRADARANLTRLTTYLEKSQGAARQFHFDADELFTPGHDEDAPDNSARNHADSAAPIIATPQAATPTAAAPQAATPTAATPQAATPTAATPDDTVVVAPVLAAPATAQTPNESLEVDSMAMFDESMLPDVEARLPPARIEPKPETPGQDATNGKQVPAQSAFMAQSDGQSAPARERTSQAATPITPAPAASATVAPATPAPTVGDRRKYNTPVAMERRRRPIAGAAVPLAASAGVLIANAPAAQAAHKPVAAPLTPSSSAPAPSAAAVPNPFDLGNKVNRPATRAPLALDVPAAPVAPLWQQMISRPSFYARTLPLVGVALLSLGFLSWARARAVSQVVAPAPTELASADGIVSTDAPATMPDTNVPLPNDAAQPNAAPATDAAGFPISNAPAVFEAPAAQTPQGSQGSSAPTAPATNNASGNSGRTSNNNAPSTTARANNRGPNSNSGNARPARVLPPARPVPRFPGVSLAPAPIPPSSARSTISGSGAGQNSGGNNIILPRPNVALPEPSAPRQRVLPPTDNALNPAGSPNRGYARVTEGRVGNGVIPSQPSAVARENERAANDAARNGQNDQAISQLSQAIRADSDNAGFRYQQRAMLFLQRGDYNRASDDFQSAISAYQSQIASGNDVAQARRGLSSARSGLSLALAGKRG